MTIGGGVTRTDHPPIDLTEEGKQVVVIGESGEDGLEVDIIAGAPSLDAPGVTVHDPMMESIDITLKHMLEEMKKQTLHLNYMTELDK